VQYTRLGLLILVAGSLASRAAAQQCSDADKAKLVELDKAWGDATRRGDRTQLEAVFADDYASTDPTGTQNKAATIDAAVRTAERARFTGQALPPTTYDHYLISCTPVSAVITHRAATTTTVNGKEQTSYFRAVHMLEKRGNRWQVVGNAGHPLDDAGILLYLEHDWNAARKRKDIAWFERNIADDATGVSSPVVQTKRQLLDAMRADKSIFDSIEMDEMNVRVDGNAAVITGISHFKGRDEQGKPFDRRYRFTGTWIKRDGRWLVWAYQSALVP
jgi:ketosteroid isomerase-like protein